MKFRFFPLEKKYFLVRAGGCGLRADVGWQKRLRACGLGLSPHLSLVISSRFRFLYDTCFRFLYDTFQFLFLDVVQFVVKLFPLYSRMKKVHPKRNMELVNNSGGNERCLDVALDGDSKGSASLLVGIPAAEPHVGYLFLQFNDNGFFFQMT